MSCGCGSTYTLTPGDRLYLSAMVKALQQRVSALEGNGISSDLTNYINAQIQGIIPGWALQPIPPTETDPTVPSWAKQLTKPAYTVAEIAGAASENYVDTKVATHANRVDNPHNVTAAQIGAVIPTDLADVAFSGDFNDLGNVPLFGAMALVSDAPSDGVSYVRRNATWVPDSGGGGPAGTPSEFHPFLLIGA